jgi:hypothetical protein
MTHRIDPEPKVKNLASAVFKQATPAEKVALSEWALEMRMILNSSCSRVEKASLAIRATASAKILLPVMKVVGSELKRHGWDERGLPARTAIGAAAAALTLSGSGAGIAALGGAIGVPLWVVFGAGGAFVGVIIDEFNKSKE